MNVVVIERDSGQKDGRYPASPGRSGRASPPSPKAVSAVPASAANAGETDVLDMLEAHGVKLTEIRAWTVCYFPFTMGGSVWRPGGAKVPCERPVQIGEFFVCLVRGPDDMTAVCEVTTGAIVGQTLEEVRRDIEDAYARGDIEMMRKQVADARENKGSVAEMTPDELWKRLASARRKATGDA